MPRLQRTPSEEAGKADPKTPGAESCDILVLLGTIINCNFRNNGKYGNVSNTSKDICQCRGYTWIMEKTMETRFWVYLRVILGLYRDNGKDNGNYYLGLRVWGFLVTMINCNFRNNGKYSHICNNRSYGNYSSNNAYSNLIKTDMEPHVNYSLNPCIGY